MRENFTADFGEEISLCQMRSKKIKKIVFTLKCLLNEKSLRSFKNFIFIIKFFHKNSFREKKNIKWNVLS